MTASPKINNSRMLDVLAQMVPFKSWSGQESPLADWLAEQAVEWGGVPEIMEVEPGRRQLNIRFKSDKPGKTLIMNGHLDIDGLAAGYRRDPWELIQEGDYLYGAGVFNMRAGLAAMIEASQSIRDMGGLPAGELILSFVVGELQGGVGAKALVEKFGGSLGDAVIVTEPYGSRNVITTHGGVATVGVVVHGVSTHTSQQELGVNAVKKAAKAIEALENVEWTCDRREDLPRLPLLNVGGILGGRGEEYVLDTAAFQPDRCMVILDIRILAGQTPESVEGDLRRTLDKLAASDPEFKYSIEHQPALAGGTIWMPPCDVPLSEPIVGLVSDAIVQVTGNQPELLGIHPQLSNAADDLARFYGVGIPGVLYGPEGGNGELGEPDTFSFVSATSLCAEVLAVSALEFCTSS